jgi:hypothetical protein
MFGRSRRNKTGPASRPENSVGVGALVIVGASPDSGWVGEPTGVIIAPGDNEMAGYPGSPRAAPSAG